ncbi:ferritin family protein [Desulfuribacillus alkaliarsenatis]|uniref:Rubrerythrin diiron-binding domain-containing protein n=1 Tax=Desulfuribacillus alkaliarsenatis TaxID=766136 RepID=A0A1E5G430_9FIRM|nr:ferritin family protein [Desulfuribacillus alkaliarsenatis]OEF97757.1 hypothetical protein BHF68_13790 [Desulfuribacillus alkaliarsenatis]
MSIKELEILKQAILIEKEGYEFYKMSAEQAKEEDVKAALLFLAEEEKQHQDWLCSLYQDINEKRDVRIDYSKLEVPEKTKQIFSWKNVSPESGSLAVSVFGIGVTMEKNAIDYYYKAMKETELPEAKALYEKLIVWESEHLDLFQKNYDLLKEDWWERQRFSPA